MSPLPDDLPILDLQHLDRQTAGDIALESELLTLFEAQCERLRPLVGDGRPAGARADAAHTLKGSARAIGASRLGVVADRLEAALRGEAPETAAAALMAGFDEVVAMTRRAAAERRRAAAA
jgi:HPt (histidine-containing phosphotransfer) domain-containing protein